MPPPAVLLMPRRFAQSMSCTILDAAHPRLPPSPCPSPPLHSLTGCRSAPAVAVIPGCRPGGAPQPGGPISNLPRGSISRTAQIGRARALPRGTLGKKLARGPRAGRCSQRVAHVTREGRSPTARGVAAPERGTGGGRSQQHGEHGSGTAAGTRIPRSSSGPQPTSGLDPEPAATMGPASQLARAGSGAPEAQAAAGASRAASLAAEGAVAAATGGRHTHNSSWPQLSLGVVEAPRRANSRSNSEGQRPSLPHIGVTPRQQERHSEPASQGACASSARHKSRQRPADGRRRRRSEPAPRLPPSSGNARRREPALGPARAAMQPVPPPPPRALAQVAGTASFGVAVTPHFSNPLGVRLGLRRCGLMAPRAALTACREGGRLGV